MSATLAVPDDLRQEETLFLRAMVVGNDLEDQDEFVAETTVDHYQIQVLIMYAHRTRSNYKHRSEFIANSGVRFGPGEVKRPSWPAHVGKARASK